MWPDLVSYTGPLALESNGLATVPRGPATGKVTHKLNSHIFSLPGQSPGRAVVLPPASALPSVSALAKY